MNRADCISRLVDDMAGHWTEPTLHVLKAAGMRDVSVDVEIETWRNLRSVLMKELGRKQAATRGTAV